MRRIATTAAALIAMTCVAHTDGRWTVETISAPGPVKAIETTNEGPLIAIGGGLFRPVPGTYRTTLAATAGPLRRPLPAGALADGRIAYGKDRLARVWLSDPATRYGRGALGDAIAAGSLTIERRDGARETVRLEEDAVFEDLEPRIVVLDGTAGEHVLVVKSYLQHGSALAVIGQRNGRHAVIAETPPIGSPNQWLNPAGIADFNGDGRTDIAIVRTPHAAGVLELWTWDNERLIKTAELGDVSNHAAGSRAQRMAHVADFDGDGRPDLAIPSSDRRALRIIAFTPDPREIARVELPSPVVTEVAAFRAKAGPPPLVLGLENGSLVVVNR